MSIYPGIPAIVPPTEQERELTADSKELRKMSIGDGHAGVQQRLWGLDARLDPSVTLEEYMFWAEIERDMENQENKSLKARTIGQGGIKGLFKGLLKAPAYEDNKVETTGGALQEVNEKGESSDAIKPVGPNTSLREYDAEWRRAARALRTASWGGIFYLITTDILGWGQTPYVFANDGYGLGVGIFFLLGLAAGASGFMIWRTFLKLDSSRYPILSFGDPFFRLYGPAARHTVNVLQSFQMFLSVAVVQLGQTDLIAELGENTDICFVIFGVIALVVGMASGYLRALKHLGWLCNFAVWMNVVSFIIIIVAATKAGPDPAPQVNSGILNPDWATHPAPVKTFVGTPPAEYQPTDSNLFAAQFNGINAMVYAYSGALLFVAFMAEMRHPWDFWKAMFCAQSFITIVYIFFGAFVYSYYGQYSYSIITEVVEPVRLQIVCNVLGLLTGWLAIFLYFNIGMKTVYLEVGQELFGLPPITSQKGKYLWWTLGPIYWILAFILSMSVPAFNAFTNFVGGLFSLNFTYSFSGMMYLGLLIQTGAKLEGEGFDPSTGVTTRHDAGVSRYIRGFKKSWKLSLPVFIYTCCGLAASGMGTWAAVLALEEAFAYSETTSWTCTNPFKA